MSTTNNLQILTGSAVTAASGKLSIQSPALVLYSSSISNDPVVQNLSTTAIYDGDTNNNYLQIIYSFQLLSALLDSAPTNSGSSTTTAGNPTLFSMTVNVGDSKNNGNYVIDAQIQTKGNSAMSPTYITKLSNGVFTFPVTNFFNVSSPGCPYTITLTATRVI